MPLRVGTTSIGDGFGGISLLQVRHHRSDAYSAEQVLLNKRQIYGGAPKVNCYRFGHCWGKNGNFCVAMFPDCWHTVCYSSL